MLTNNALRKQRQSFFEKLTAKQAAGGTQECGRTHKLCYARKKIDQKD
jgi:hypothetical protein